MSILQGQNDITIHKNFFTNKAVSDGAISSYLDQLVSTRVSKFTYGSSSNPDYQYQSLLKTRSPPFLGQGVSVGLSVLSYSKTLTRSCSFPFFENLSIRRRRNQDDLITGLQILWLVYEFLFILFGAGVTVETSHSNVGRR